MPTSVRSSDSSQHRKLPHQLEAVRLGFDAPEVLCPNRTQDLGAMNLQQQDVADAFSSTLDVPQHVPDSVSSESRCLGLEPKVSESASTV